MTGRALGVDVGTVRVGVAATDAAGVMAFPVETVKAGRAAAVRVAEIAAERESETVYVGLPRHMGGGEGESAAKARRFAALLAERTPATVRLVDERRSTVSASAAMHEAGRSARDQRSVIDQAAAVVILEGALEMVRAGTVENMTDIVRPKGTHA